MMFTKKATQFSLICLTLIGLFLSVSSQPTAAKPLAYTPADPSLASYAQNVLNKMEQIKGKSWIAGQQEIHWDSSRKDEMSNAVRSHTNPQQSPGLRGWDFPFGGAGANDAQWMIDTMISDWNTYNILPEVTQHWTPFKDSQGTVHDDMMIAGDIDKLFTNGTTERNRYLTWRQNLGDDIAQLQTAQVPVLLRPFHETGGGWFWWDKDDGTNNSTKYKQLYNDLFTYLKDTRGLHNIIWLWGPGRADGSTGTEWYPGDSKVDILGADNYSDSTANYASEYNDLGRFSSTKLRAITECDYMMDASQITSYPFVYFMEWHSGYLTMNSDAKINGVYNSSRTISRSNMKALFDGTLGNVMADFEAGTDGWTGGNLAAGPWSVTDFAANGSKGLKGDIVLGNAKTYFTFTQDQNLTGYTTLQARVKHATWGNMGSGMTAKVYVKTGSSWTWYAGNATSINGTGSTVLSLDLTTVTGGVSSVREVGVEFQSPADSSGNTSIYLDYVTLSNQPIGPTATPTNTPVPPTATNTPLPPTATNTPGPTNTPTNTPVPPTATNTPLPPTATNTPLPNPGTTLYNFEGGNVQGWTGGAITGGPWSVTEWAANGTNSLKADIALGNAKTYLRLTQDQSLAAYTTLQARVKHATWGNMGSGMTAKVYVKTGTGWTWYAGNTAAINGTGSTVLTLDLTTVAGLGSVREIGVEFQSPADSSGTSAIYVDYVTAN